VKVSNGVGTQGMSRVSVRSWNFFCSHQNHLIESVLLGRAEFSRPFLWNGMQKTIPQFDLTNHFTFNSEDREL
jgi:hypothetical protein